MSNHESSVPLGMQSSTSRRTAVSVAVGIAVAAALAMLFLKVETNQSQVLELGLGVFAGFAGALTFALALLATTITQWPPITALILRPPIIAWAVLSIVSVSVSFIDSFAHHIGYAVVALASTAAAAAVGAGALVEVLAVVAGSERIRFHGRLLASGLRKATIATGSRSGHEAQRLCKDFLSAAATDAATDTTRLITAFEVLLNAAELFVDEGSVKDRREGEAVLRLLLEFQMLLPGAMRRGDALDEMAMLLERASSQVAVISGRLGDRADDGPTPACWLAAQTRTHNWTATCVGAIAEITPDLTAQCDRVIGRVKEAQTIVRRCIDPDPPLEVIPARHPWHLGVRGDPLGIMVWFGSAFEYNGIVDNNAALYVAHESLLGKKTTSDYNYGFVLRDIERGVEENEALRRTFDDYGGFTALLLDVLAGSLATCSHGSWAQSQRRHVGEGWVTEGARARATRIAWIVPSGPDPDPSVDAVLDLVVQAVSRRTRRGFEYYRRVRLASIESELQPPWSRVLETPIFHVAAGALMLASWSDDPRRALNEFGERVGPGCRRATKAVLDTVLRNDLDLDQVRANALDTSAAVSAAAYADLIVGYLDGVR
jgi:hypothetical protein